MMQQSKSSSAADNNNEAYHMLYITSEFERAIVDLGSPGRPSIIHPHPHAALITFCTRRPFGFSCVASNIRIFVAKNNGR